MRLYWQPAMVVSTSWTRSCRCERGMQVKWTSNTLNLTDADPAHPRSNKYQLMPIQMPPHHKQNPLKWYLRANAILGLVQ
jgi:hypothetical protein